MKEYLRDLLTINIGKNGINQGVVDEIKLMLKKRKIVRVKFLKSFMEQEKKTRSKKEIFQDIAKQTNSRLDKAVGFVAILRKK